MTGAAFCVGCARRGGARPCASYGSRAVCVIVVLLLCTAAARSATSIEMLGGCPVPFSAIRAGAPRAHGALSERLRRGGTGPRDPTPEAQN